MKNKKFKDLSNNKVVQVTDQFEDIIILDGKTKVKMNQLMDKRYFEDYIDPQSFFKNEEFGGDIYVYRRPHLQTFLTKLQ